MTKSVYDPHNKQSEVAFADDIPTALSELSDDSTHRVVTDTEKSTWNGKSSVIASATGTATDTIKYITIDGTEWKLGGSDKLVVTAYIDSYSSVVTSHSVQQIYNAIQNGYDVVMEYSDNASGRTFILDVDSYYEGTSPKRKHVYFGALVGFRVDGHQGDSDDPTGRWDTWYHTNTNVPTRLQDLSSSSNYRTVTDAQKTAWTAKAEISDIPTNVSELTNDSGYITSAVFMVTFTYDDNDELVTETTVEEFNNAYDSGKSILIAIGGPGFQEQMMYYFFTIAIKTPTMVAGTMLMDGITALAWDLSTGTATIHTMHIPSEPVISASTLLASMWSDGEYSFPTYPFNEYNIEVELNGDAATEEQIEAWSGAKMIGSANSNKLYAKGDVPTINIPIILKVVAK